MSSLLTRMVFSSLPNLLTILLSVGLFCSLYPLRDRPRTRLAVAAVACLGLSLASAAVHDVLIPQLEPLVGETAASAATPVFFVLVLMACYPLSRLVFDLGTWDALFCCALGYTLQNFSHALWTMLSTLMSLDAFAPSPSAAAVQLAVKLAVLAAGYALIVRPMHANHLTGEGDRRAMALLASVIAVNIVLDHAMGQLTEHGALIGAAYLMMRALQLFASALTLALGYELLYSKHMRANAAAARQMAEDERRQYKLSQDTIEAINVRCHDIRHQVRQLSHERGADRAFMEDLSGLISVYDAGAVQTGNRALDTILTEKSILCQSKGIGLTCTVDGSLLDFMEEQDVYSLFGNALDNAIEAVERVEDADRRLIDVSARSAGQMVSVQVRNFYEGELQGNNGQLTTTKTDGGLHGYGMKSMRLIAGRYDGTLTFNGDDGIFRLSILLPRPAA